MISSQVEGSACQQFGRIDGVDMRYLSISTCPQTQVHLMLSKFLKLWLCRVLTVGTILNLIGTQHAIGSSICSFDCCDGVTVVEMRIWWWL
jgi:hypothetical protein